MSEALLANLLPTKVDMFFERNWKHNRQIVPLRLSITLGCLPFYDHRTMSSVNTGIIQAVERLVGMVDEKGDYINGTSHLGSLWSPKVGETPGNLGVVFDQDTLDRLGKTPTDIMRDIERGLGRPISRASWMRAAIGKDVSSETLQLYMSAVNCVADLDQKPLKNFAELGELAAPKRLAALETTTTRRP